jgi:hypothetical protein
VAQFVKTPSHSSYTAEDSLQFVVPFLKSKQKEDVAGSEECLPSEVNDEVIVDNADLDVCEENALFYLTGWVAFKLKNDLRSCGACVAWIVNSSDDSNLCERNDIQLTRLKSFGALDYGLTIPSDSLKNLLFSAEKIFICNKSECVNSSDVLETLMRKCNSFMTDSAIPSCHDLAHKALTRFFKVRLHIWCKQFNKASEDFILHGSKSAKSRCTIK